MVRMCCLCLMMGMLSLASQAFAEPKAMEGGSLERLEYQEAALNDTYRRIFKAYADDPVFLARLREAQRAWLKFRDAELKALFPRADYPDLKKARNVWLERLAADRTLQLSRWLMGAEPDDMARGSIKIAPVEKR